MIQTVVKRDGRIVGFNDQKIQAAIRKAMLHTEKGEDEYLIERITDHIAARGKAQMSVEDIQDAVEVELMKSARKDVAQKYIAYRNQPRRPESLRRPYWSTCGAMTSSAPVRSIWAYRWLMAPGSRRSSASTNMMYLPVDRSTP